MFTFALTDDMLFQLTPSRRATLPAEVFQIKPEFQLTPSRRATCSMSAKPDQHEISTHALTEGD